MKTADFINRDLSWLQFNARVLEEAADPTVPLLERLKFAAIFSNNLDEFYMVRVAATRQQTFSSLPIQPDPTGLTPAEILHKLVENTQPLLAMQARIYHGLLEELSEHGLFLKHFAQLKSHHQNFIANYFETQVLPALTPVAVDPSHPFPLLANGAIEIAVALQKEGQAEPVYAFVEVPGVLSRFVQIPDEKEDLFILMEEVIMAFLGKLFTNCQVLAAFPFRVTRDMDFTIDEESTADLLTEIEQELHKRRNREIIRLELPPKCDPSLCQWLLSHIGNNQLFTFELDVPLALNQFFELIGKAGRPELQEAAWPPVQHPLAKEESAIFDSIQNHSEILIEHPYQSFDLVLRFLKEAAEDPDVLAIKQTLYRVSGNSPVVRALQRAARQGKQVTVIVELKARFDEENNIIWARKLEEAGAHVIYGVAGLKIHCKMLMVVRREEGLIRRYVHLGTGNYNDKTAKLYTDLGLLSDHPGLCSEVAQLFNVMTGYSEFTDKGLTAASPFNSRARFCAMIEREIRHTQNGRPGRIIAKMNSLADPDMARAIWAAAEAGVEIDLIVRGICCLKVSDDLPNLRIMSILDRFLEHSRIYYFANNGTPEVYLSSADWMPRNLNRRIELLFPVLNSKNRDYLLQNLQVQLNDRIKGRFMLPDGSYQFLPKEAESARSQWVTYQHYQHPTAETTRRLKVFTTPQ